MGSECTYAVHAEVVPDAVLPALRLAVCRLIGVPPEPLIDVAQDHGVVGCLKQRAVDKLCIGLVPVNGTVILETSVVGRRATGGVRPCGWVVEVALLLGVIAVGEVIVVAEMSELRHTVIWQRRGGVDAWRGMEERCW